MDAESDEEFENLYQVFVNFLKSVNNGLTFHEYFLKNKLEMFKNHMRRDYKKFN